MLAKKLGFDEVAIKEIIIGALLHDIGLIFVDKEILTKVDSDLEEDELMVKQKHCSLGKMPAKSSKIPYRSQEIIEQHHEKLDGTGYPHALTKDEVLPEAHIVAIADVLDTETTYKAKGNARVIEDMLNEMYHMPEKYNKKYIIALKEIFGQALN